MNSHIHHGFSVIETIILIAILGIMLVVIVSFENDMFSLNAYIRDSLDSQQQSKQFLVTFVDEIRSASSSNTGTYPIAEATDASFMFYSDIDNNGTKERIRYFLDGSTLKKSILSPTGSPLGY
ncbi:MAG TPA: type II secretion system protein, partial [Patescibacteria group bacterium]|nr:type II secretion system protein [Patescibacteria group bacterium]